MFLILSRSFAILHHSIQPRAALNLEGSAPLVHRVIFISNTMAHLVNIGKPQKMACHGSLDFFVFICLHTERIVLISFVVG